jgi:hypothetical protein
MPEVPAGVDCICVHCSKVVSADRRRLCNHCGLPFAPVGDPYQHLLEAHPATIIRRYRGREPVRSFAEEAAILGERGYAPISHHWERNQDDYSDLLLSLLLVSKPEAALTVTYARRGPAVPPASPSPPQERDTGDADPPKHG